MQTIVKIPRFLFEQVQVDLQRPHPIAFERVGFFSTRCSRTRSKIIVHCIAYHPVAESHYVADANVGVRIGSHAITAAMGRITKDRVGQIHVHYHGGECLPHPSETDNRELPRLVESLRNANQTECHGWMVLSESDAWTSLSLPSLANLKTAPVVSIVGFPTTVNRRFSSTGLPKMTSWLARLLKHTVKTADRYDRQSFLGAHSSTIIKETMVGVVGLGGGGSHVVQQLAHLGFRNFVLCDHDRISESNLNRLVGGTSADVRVKRLKTTIAKRSIHRLDKNANVITHASKWEDSVESLIGCDLIIGCVDKFGARRDLEAFCRRHMIPYIDVGMDVDCLSNGRFEIYGQVILSMPGKPCMHCMGFLNEKVLGKEAQEYGAAGSKPQVVWSNGILCSAAVGVAVDLLTDWSKTCRHQIYLSFRGSELSLGSDKRLTLLKDGECPHFRMSQVGDLVMTPI